MDKEKIEATLKGALKAYPELFLLDLTITANNDICIRLDGDRGVSLEDCVNINHYLKENLGHDMRDYTLEVSSAGVGEPLKSPRQYPKNCGRLLDLLTKGGNHYKALLKEVGEKEITLEWTECVSKPQGKGKKKIVRQHTILYEDITQAKILIKF